LSTILGSTIGLAYERAVIFPKSEALANRVLVLSILISILVAGLIFALIVLVSFVWPEWLENQGLGVYIFVVPLGALLMAMRGTVGSLCLRREDFSAIATADVSEAIVSTSTRVLWGIVLASSVSGLILGHVLGIVVSLAICGSRSLTWFKKEYHSASIADLRKVAYEFRDYPIFRAPARIALTASRRMPVVALGILFSPEIVGFYAMASRAAALPLQTISKSVSNVLLRRTMGFKHEGRPLRNDLQKVAAVLALTGLPVFSVMFFFGEEVLSWFLGARWRSAGEIVEILAPFLFVIWASSFAPTVFETLRLNKLRLKLHSLNLVLQIALFAICGFLGIGTHETLWLFVAVSCFYQTIVYVVAFREVVKHDEGMSIIKAGE